MTIQSPVRRSIAPRLAAAVVLVAATAAVATLSESAHLVLTVPLAAIAGWMAVRPRARRLDPVAVRRLEEWTEPAVEALPLELRARKAS